jgi:hypothetical protein
MPRTIRVALFCTDQEQGKRLRIAASLQAGNGFEVRLSDKLDETTELALLDPEWPDADLLLGRLRRMMVSVVQLGQADRETFSDQQIDPDQSIALIQRRLRDLLAATAERGDPKPKPVPALEVEPLLVRLCREENLAAARLSLRLDELELLVLRDASRILAASETELKLARARIGEAGWTVDAPRQTANGADSAGCSGSLDGFLIEAALAERTRLPAIAPNRFKLLAWPDLTACGEPAVVRLSALLVNGRWSAADLVKRSGADAATVNALLWALTAAGLLETRDSVTPVEARGGPTGHRPGLISRLARHFGLGHMQAA